MIGADRPPSGVKALQSILAYFSHNHRLTNLLFILVLTGGVISWLNLKKEEMPEFETNWLRISASYPGASADDIEQLLVLEIEKRLKGVTGIERVYSQASPGVASISAYIRPNQDDKKVVIQAIKDAALEADLPDRVRETVRFFQFKTAEKAIIDIALTLKDSHILSFEERQNLQSQAKALESSLISSPLISAVDRKSFRQEEINIFLDPAKLKENEIPVSQVIQSIRSNNVRLPLGSLSDVKESKVAINNELKDVESLKGLPITSNFDRNAVSLEDLAVIDRSFKKSRSILKINGREAVILNIKKSFDADITKAKLEVDRILEQFQKSRLDTGLEVLALDDESFVIRNRLNIVANNGIMGFVLILICLFLFLDLKSGFWVAMGIPFSLAFTLIFALYYGFTVNNVTLAAIIIVLGIVVDDAIIVAENVSRQRSLGLSPGDASVKGTRQVIFPIIASILTTCVAFLPFYFFEGRFSAFVVYIPSIVTLMLLGSLVESLFILPSHLQGFQKSHDTEAKSHWFFKVEERFSQILGFALRFRSINALIFILILGGSIVVLKEKLKFTLFPKGESKEVFIKAKAKDAKNVLETAEISKKIEELLLEDDQFVLGIRSRIGQSRRGRRAGDNAISYRIELQAKEVRKLSSGEISEQWQEKLKALTEFEGLKVIKGRFGFSSSSPLEILIQDNNDANRRAIAESIKKAMEEIETIDNVEIEEPLMEKTYELKLNRQKISQLGLSIQSVAETVRTYIAGQVLYTIYEDEQELEYRLSSKLDSMKSIEDVLDQHVANQSGYLVPLRDILTVVEMEKPISISRQDFKRTTELYGDLKEGVDSTPLELAEYMEAEVFPKILSQFPNALVRFTGEVEESRKSRSGFGLSILLAVLLIYGILIILFNSFTLPFLILAIIPFGLAGVILAFYAHQKTTFGFFAVVGAIGMSGVVVNDSIVLISTLKERLSWKKDRLVEEIAKISSSRLRAVLVTTITTVAGLFPTAYGLGGEDAMLAEMMLAMAWGLIFGTFITLGLLPILFSYYAQIRLQIEGLKK